MLADSSFEEFGNNWSDFSEGSIEQVHGWGENRTYGEESYWYSSAKTGAASWNYRGFKLFECSKKHREHNWRTVCIQETYTRQVTFSAAREIQRGIAILAQCVQIFGGGERLRQGMSWPLLMHERHGHAREVHQTSGRQMPSVRNCEACNRNERTIYSDLHQRSAISPFLFRSTVRMD